MQISNTFLILVAGLSLGQAVGVGFFLEPFALILRKMGVALEYLGLLYFLGLFMAIRFLWASFVDRLNFGFFGHYKDWLLITQIFIIISLMGASFCDIKSDFWAILAFATIFAFMAATQYIAIDGLIYKATYQEDRIRANSFKFMGGLLGYIIGGGFGLILYAKLAWQNTLLLLSIAPVFTLVLLLLYKENKVIKNIQKSISLRDIFRYFAVNKKWLYFLLIYPVMISTFFGLYSKILLDSGWSFEKIGLIANIFGFIFAAFCAFISPILIQKIKPNKILILMLMLQIIGLLMLIFINKSFNKTWFVLLVICVVFFSYSHYSVLISTLMMNRIKSESPAFEYSLQHSLFFFVGVFYNGLSLVVAGFLGYESTISLAVILGIYSIYLTLRLNTDKYS